MDERQLSGAEANVELFEKGTLLRRTPLFKSDARVNVLSYPLIDADTLPPGPPPEKWPPAHIASERNASLDEEGPRPEWEIVDANGFFLANTEENRKRILANLKES